MWISQPIQVIECYGNEDAGPCGRYTDAENRRVGVRHLDLGNRQYVPQLEETHGLEQAEESMARRGVAVDERVEAAGHGGSLTRAAPSPNGAGVDGVRVRGQTPARFPCDPIPPMEEVST